MEQLHSGWLIKSPPEKKTLGPWRLFKSKWRQRFFVLYAPPSSQSIPGSCSAVLCYYDDNSLTKEYGRIDLNHCEEILTQLESDEYRFVFALRTVNKDHDRTYYLAADTEEDMNEWASCLCCVLRLSGGDGITLSSSFGHLTPNGEGFFNATLPRCSILTQKNGEQKRLSNVPDTLTKSATALNIRVAELTPHSTNTVGRTKNSQGRKRQSILNMVVKPAANTLRRPSCPSLSLTAKFQTLTQTGVATPPIRQNNVMPQLTSYSHDGDFSSHPSALEKSIPRFHFEPASPMTTQDTFSFRQEPFVNRNKEHEDRWRTPGASTEGQQCPPALPSRITRAQSSVHCREKFQGKHCYRNSMEDSYSKVVWRNSDLVDETYDEGSRDPDYDLPKANYDNIVRRHSEEDTSQNEATEDDQEDDYNYPTFLYGPDERNTLSVVEENELGTDSYDYLPVHSKIGSRTSAGQSSYKSNSDNHSMDDHGIYDILPKRNSFAGDSGEYAANRMSGLEDSVFIYQNDIVTCSSADAYDYPVMPASSKKEKSTDCDSALIQLLCVHG